MALPCISGDEPDGDGLPIIDEAVDLVIAGVVIDGIEAGADEQDENMVTADSEIIVIRSI
jgi:hypothetical protein